MSTKQQFERILMKTLYHIGLAKEVSNYLFVKNHGKRINYRNPQMLDEKLMVLKHTSYWNNPLVSKCADKYGVREYVTAKGCPEILTELVGKQVYDSVDDIDWDTLPNQFALKCTHGCKMNIVVDDKCKFEKQEVFIQLKQWQKEKFGYQTGEWQYLRIPPRIICERYYGAVNGVLPVDYKLFCMNGRVVCTLVCSERESGKLKLVFMNNEWKRIEIDSEHIDGQYVISRPRRFEDMKRYAEILSKEFPFVRVDFYEYGDQIVLSELTFTPALNCMTYITDEGQILLGNELQLDNEDW